MRNIRLIRKVATCPSIDGAACTIHCKTDEIASIGVAHVLENTVLSNRKVIMVFLFFACVTNNL